MEVNDSSSPDILYAFCGNVPFWDSSTVEVATPVFSTCFLDTVLVWGPCAYLWILSPFFVIYMHVGKRLTPLPLSKLNISKAVVSFLIICTVILQLIFQEHDGYSCDANTAISAASYTATGLKFITFILTVVLQQIQRYRGYKTSGVPFVFWLLLIACEIFSLYEHAQRKVTCGEDVAFYIYFVLLCVQFVLHCFAEQYSEQGYHEIEEENPCPDENASVLRRVLFDWLTPVVVKCYKGRFTPAEFWNQTSRLKADYLGPLLDDAWKEEIHRCDRERRLLLKQSSSSIRQSGTDTANGFVNRRNGTISEETPLIESGKFSKRETTETVHLKPNLYKTLFRTYIWVWTEATSYMAWAEVLWLLQPIILRFVIQMIETEGHIEAEWKGYLYAVLLFIILCINSFMYHVSFHHMLTLGLKIKASLICLIYKKAITMNRSGLKSTTVGEVVNLMSVDCQRIQDAFMFSFYVVCIFLILIIAVVQLWDLMGVASLGGLAVILFVLPTVGFIATKQYKLQKELLRLKSSRIKILNEVISGIKVLKMYAWEPSFMKRIQAIRNSEINCLWKYALYAATTIVFAVHSPFMINFILILIYVLTSPTHSLGAEETFTALSIINIIRYPIALCPFLVNGAVQGYVSIGRIQEFLWTEDIKTDNVNIVKQAENPVSIESGDFAWNADIDKPVLTKYRTKTECETCDRTKKEIGWCRGYIKFIGLGSRICLAIKAFSVNDTNLLFSIYHVALSILEVEKTLRSTRLDVVINLRVKEGELVAVVGQVGCGKSSLISACLGEMVRLSGKVSLKGKVAYVPQEAWIQNMTLRDNILFGKKYQEKKYRKVLDACALLPDLEILAGGDMTEIGEKGINISGGQKQRVSLARSVYNNADVYFLDDPLSAVDSHVGKHLFQKVIGNQGLLRHKTRILVTHGIHWLPMVDRIVVLNNGMVTEVGSYEELISHNGDFAQFLQQYLQQDDDEETDPEILEIKNTIRSQIDEPRSDGGITSEDDAMTASGRVIRRRRSTRVSAYTSSRSISKQKDSAPFSTGDLNRLTVDETSQEGAIKAAVLLTYIKAMGVSTVVVVFVTMSLFQGLNIFSNFWLTYWTEDELLKNVSLSETKEYEDKYLFYLLMYLGMGVLQGIFVFISFYMALTRMVRASGILHNSMLKSILRSPMSFFDTTPIGRMMNRFSSDVDIMDNKLPESFRLWSIMVFSTLAVIVVVGVTTPIFIAAIVPIAILYAFAVKFYLPTARQMRRTESVKRSPIYNHFSETITGSAVIRAYRCSERFIQESRNRVDANIKFYYASNTGARWIGIRLELLGNVIAFLATVFGLISDDLNGAQVGLSITYAVQITITLNLVVLAISEMEMNIVSAERVTEYTTLPSEAGWILESSKPPEDWPKSGKIEFRNFLTRYREGLDLVLRGINCSIADGEKIGIVGRTGAGKSSLALCLFRLIESAGGSILIDSVDISKLGLHDLRRKLTILPQDPVLFSGSLRTNLDPFGRYNDENIWYALECAHLRDFVNGLETGLNYECGEGGQNLSVGQRQLVCLARTLLHKTRVLILDEATAAVDMETDDLIQDTIRSQFKDCTILTVAHRLNTIMDYDRVLVLDAGLIKEFDSPKTLLQDAQGVFYGMAKNAGLV